MVLTVILSYFMLFNTIPNSILDESPMYIQKPAILWEALEDCEAETGKPDLNKCDADRPISRPCYADP